jgi:uncharacterized protein YdhG (YjbR/CyaY superfamily)
MKRSSEVDAYIDAQPEVARAHLEKLRALIRAALPQAEECIAYQMPTYKIAGAPAVYFAGWKKHVSLYPANKGVLAELGDAAAPFLAAKSTLQLRFDQPLPVSFVKRFLAARKRQLVMP